MFEITNKVQDGNEYILLPNTRDKDIYKTKLLYFRGIGYYTDSLNYPFILSYTDLKKFALGELTYLYKRFCYAYNVSNRKFEILNFSRTIEDIIKSAPLKFGINPFDLQSGLSLYVDHKQVRTGFPVNSRPTSHPTTFDNFDKSRIDKSSINIKDLFSNAELEQRTYDIKSDIIDKRCYMNSLDIIIPMLRNNSATELVNRIITYKKQIREHKILSILQ